MNERTLTLLAMKYVDDVLIGAPHCPTDILLKRLNISVVVDGIKKGENPEPSKTYTDETDPFRVAKKLGIYQLIEIGNFMTSRDLILRVKSNEVVLRQVFEKKKAKQNAYYESKIPSKE